MCVRLPARSPYPPTGTFWTRTYNRLLRPGHAHWQDSKAVPIELHRTFHALNQAIDNALARAKLAA